MAIKFVEKIFGSHSQRELKMILPLVRQGGESASADAVFVG